MSVSKNVLWPPVRLCVVCYHYYYFDSFSVSVFDGPEGWASNDAGLNRYEAKESDGLR